MKVKDWVDDFRGRHHARFPRDDWPDGWDDGWLAAFVKLGVTEPEADAASVNLMDFPRLPHAQDHLPWLIRSIQAARAATIVPDDDRESARLASLGCLHCNATGLCTIYHPDYRGHPALLVETTAGPAARVLRCAAHCVCELGRWMRAHAEPAVLRRIPDLQRTLDGHTRWTVADPTVPDGSEVDGATWQQRADWVRAVAEEILVPLEHRGDAD